MKFLSVLLRALWGRGPIWLIALLAIVIAACSSTGPSAAPTGGPGGSPAPSPSATADPNTIEHATGATDVVLRFEEAGGMIGPAFFVSQGPGFTLYGDGTVIFRSASAASPEPVDGVSVNSPYQTVRLSEEQVQTLLQFAIGPGALGIARARYDLPVADAPTATFRLTAAGKTRTVSVNGLGFGSELPGVDGQVLASLLALKQRLIEFGDQVTGEVPWTPDRYRGYLIDNAFGPQGAARAWPWPAIKINEFAPSKNPDLGTFPIRTFTPAEVAVLGIKGVEGGMQGISMTGPDGKVYTFSLRPLWPDETS